jgi:hypothetical protein
MSPQTALVIADSNDVDTAVMNTLAADPELMGLMPDGVFWELAPLNATAFVIVSQLEHTDSYVLDGGLLWERILYLAKAVHFGSSATNARKAAFRIYQLLQDARLEVPTYTVVACQRDERVKYVDVDEETDVRWQHRGGHYELLVTPRPVSTGTRLAA